MGTYKTINLTLPESYIEHNAKVLAEKENSILMQVACGDESLTNYVNEMFLENGQLLKEFTKEKIRRLDDLKNSVNRMNLRTITEIKEGMTHYFDIPLVRRGPEPKAYQEIARLYNEVRRTAKRVDEVLPGIPEFYENTTERAIYSRTTPLGNGNT